MYVAETADTERDQGGGGQDNRELQSEQQASAIRPAPFRWHGWLRQIGAPSRRTKLRIWNIKTCGRPCVKAKQTIVKSCEEKRIEINPCERVGYDEIGFFSSWAWA